MYIIYLHKLLLMNREDCKKQKYVMKLDVGDYKLSFDHNMVVFLHSF